MAAPAALTTPAPAWRSPEDAFAPFRDEPFALLLHGGGAGERGRRSLLLARPAFTLLSETGEAVFDALRARAGLAPTPAFGWAGLLSYDLAASLERLPSQAAPDGWPAAALGWYPAALVFDHDAQSIGVTGDPEAGEALLREMGPAGAPRLVAGRARLRPVWSERRYLAAAGRARDYVRAGDVFQVNLSHPFEAELDGADAPYAVFRRLAAASPAAFAGYFRLDRDRAVLTNSPERFLRVTADGWVEARPIKGTRPRGANAAEDDALAAELAASPKDRAENLMIVDLMRNDLARACAPGSVSVEELFSVERFANVHHLVSSVRGRLETGCDAYDLLRGAFPPGSITGAPKVRAMEIIAELEGEPRGPYCGALGWTAPDGGADLNVMIRTASFGRTPDGWRVRARSGGAITSDSDPAAELSETRDKLAALAAAIAGTDR